MTMLPKKTALFLSSIAITLLTNVPYASDTPSTSSDIKKGVGLPHNKSRPDASWIKNPQTTTAAEAAQKARKERLAEMQGPAGKDTTSNRGYPASHPSAKPPALPPREGEPSEADVARAKEELKRHFHAPMKNYLESHMKITPGHAEKILNKLGM